MNRKMLGLLLVVLAAILVRAGSMVYFALTPADPNSSDSLILEVTKGQSPAEITRLLADQKVISDPKEFFLLGRITRNWRSIKTGEYKFSPKMSPVQVFAVLSSGVSVAHPLTIREGENMYEIAADLESRKMVSKEKFLELCRSSDFIKSLGFENPLPPSLEGYLYPNTYFFSRSTSPEEMIKQMYKQFQSNWTPELAERARQLGLSRHQTVTLASMIEKETGAQKERPMISSVFHNRLKKKMKLQSDPTTIYGIWERYQGNIHRSDLLSQTPYNTYVIPSLPIGPIGNPGAEALRAAVFPSTSPYLYFVSHNDGTHEFTETFEKHTAAVRKFQLDPKAREGKSWRDLNNKKQLPES